jgi:hypothetical protein
MIKNCNGEKVDVILMDWHVFSAIEFEQVLLECRPSVCLHVCIDVCLDGACTVERILLMFGIRELIRHRSLSGDYENSDSKKTKALHTKW